MTKQPLEVRDSTPQGLPSRAPGRPATLAPDSCLLTPSHQAGHERRCADVRVIQTTGAYYVVYATSLRRHSD